MKRQQQIALAIFVLSLLFGAIGLWWWALVGMSAHVAAAWWTTCLVPAVFSGITLMVT